MAEKMTAERQWVEQTLDSMTVEELAGQMMCPLMHNYKPGDYTELLKEIPLGAVFFPASGAELLTVTLRNDAPIESFLENPAHDLPEVDVELRKRGYNVDHLTNPHPIELAEKAERYDAVFVNIVLYPHAVLGTINMTGKMVFALMKAFWTSYPNTIFTSFGTPYILYQQPHLPNLLCTFSPCPASQRAAVKAWLGEIIPAGKCPVKMPRQIK